ncbi:12166_t:CDS:2 [Dentiscutata heterogama]|uniref:12166_t:CDS:1 n=1 Tax=Dentiscutata heterogama TaxID=1316150 RepID=A0ACA9L6R5_9GLOM|nr:12166_t:CDS:2 [Dentiscutata heterogama]
MDTEYWRKDGEYPSSYMHIKQEPQDYPQETSTRASELASNFLSNLSLTPKMESNYVKQEPETTPDKAFRSHDEHTSHRDRSRDRNERHRSVKEEDDRDRREKKRDRERSDKDRDRDRDRDRSDRDRDKDKDRDRERRRERERSRDRSRRERERDEKEDRERKARRPRKRSRSPSNRRRSRSPRHHSRSRSITPINRRRRKLNNWDLPPPGYEGMTAEQVKATGHFPLPGQPATTRPTTLPTSPLIAGMDPSRAAAMMMGMTHELPPRPKVSQGAAGPVAQTASLARQARRLYNGLSEFFNSTMVQLNITTAPGQPVIAVQINHDKNYAFVEVKATAAMAFDGITFQGQSLKIRRPKDYQPPPGQNLEPPPIHVPGVVSTNVPDSPNKIFIGGLPTYLNDEQVMELLKSFGELRAFNLVKDSLTACQGLNNMELGDRKLVVQRASVGSAKNTGVASVLPSSVLIPSGNGEMIPTTVLQLLNMVTPEELVDDEEYEDIVDDVREECSKFGRVLDMKIPRPGSGSISGVGKIFVRFESIEAAGAALRALAGRKFAERTVLTSYIDEEMYYAEDF